ncbi:MAG: hypothetical protein HY010_20785 [Acidobacteria bacterium]|nr:hypothetical protein [Acidobacteriota bacterium]
MARRTIAVVLLFAVATWAELRLAPMIAMGAAHTHAAHATAPAMVAHHHAAALPHPCCPSVQTTPVVNPPVELAPAGLPCEDNHRCCFRSGPLGTPASVSDEQKTARDFHLLRTVALTSDPTTEENLPIQRVHAQSPPSTFSMTLRI